MNKKDKAIYQKDKLKYLFYPNTSLILTLIMSVITVVLMFIILSNVEKGEIGYEITFALLTGIIASIPIAIAIEMSNNLKNNTLAWYELYEYHKALLDYKYLDSKTEDNTFIYLYKFMPIFIKTLDDKKAFLSPIEIDYLEEIVHEYSSIKLLVVDYLKENIKKTNKTKDLEKILSDITYDKDILEKASDLLSNKEGLIYLSNLSSDEIKVHTISIASNIELLVKEASKKPVFDIMIDRLNKTEE